MARAETTELVEAAECLAWACNEVCVLLARRDMTAEETAAHTNAVAAMREVLRLGRMIES